MLAATALVVVFCGSAMAKVTGVCANCHTMHNSQGGSDLAGGPRATLLTNSCVGCHSSGDSTTISNEGGCPTPVVNYTGGEPSTYLAGGNFYWVQTEGGLNMSDAKGHNVFASNPDGTLSTEAPGNWVNCDNSCHKSLAYTEEQQTSIPELGTGCTGCHLFPTHHASDTGPVIDNSPAGEGWYRFLSAHSGGSTPSGDGVTGIEDDEWQANASLTEHNEYLGNEVSLQSAGGINSLGNVMTGFCCGCHGNFHEEQNTSGEWIRHPSDAVIPNTPGSEYADAFGANGTGTGTYDPLVPVARPSLSAVSPSVAIGTDMVMCLSCHRPHGSPYDDLLRWQYNGIGGMIAGSGPSTTGCFACHTKKDTGG